MLNHCGEVGDSIGLKFNANKSMCMVVGPKKCKPAQMFINGTAMQWAESIKYLGVTIVSAKAFTVDLKIIRRKFFASVNTILSKCKYTSEFVKL